MYSQINFISMHTDNEGSHDVKMALGNIGYTLDKLPCERVKVCYFIAWFHSNLAGGGICLLSF